MAPSASLMGTGTVSAAKWPLSQFSWARRCDSAGEGVHPLAGDPVAAGQDLRHLELGHQLPVAGGQEVGRERSHPTGGVRGHRAPGSWTRRRRRWPGRSSRTSPPGPRSAWPAASCRTGGRRWSPARTGAGRRPPRRCGSRCSPARRPGSRCRPPRRRCARDRPRCATSRPCRAWPSRSVGCQPASAPLRLPMGVRTVSTMTASRSSMAPTIPDVHVRFDRGR